MKKSVVLACLALLLCFSAVGMAQEPPKMGSNAPAMAGKNTTDTPAMCPMMGSNKQGMKMEKNDNMGQGMKMGMCTMHNQMMKSMTEKTIVATSDGGVVVMIGNKLIKYDKNLKLVNEAEIKMDMQAMQKMMTDAKEKCPMCKEMKKMQKQMPDKK